MVQDVVGEDRRGRHQVGAFRVDARQFEAIGQVAFQNTAADARDLIRRSGCAAEPSEFLAARRARHRNQGVDGTRGADRALNTIAARAFKQVAHLVSQMCFQIANLARAGRIIGEELLGDARNTELEAAHPHRFAVAHHHQFDAATTDVHQQMRTAFEAHRMPRGDED